MIGLGGAGGSVGKAGRLKTANDANAAWTVNQRGSGNIVDFQAGGVSKFSISAAGVATMAAPAITGGSVIELTAFSLRSSGAAYDLVIATTAIYTADRTLTVNIPTTGNAAITLTGDLIRSGAHSLTLTTSAATSVTLPTSGTLVSSVTTGNGVSATNTAGALAFTLGVITPTSVNGLTLTAAAVGFTIAGGTTSKTLTISNTLTLTATDDSTLAIGAGGTLGSAAYTASTAYEAAGGIATHAALTATHGATGAIVGTTNTQAFATGIKTFNSSILAIRNPADTFKYVIVGGAIIADRNLTLPLLTGDDVLVTADFIQTLTNKTLTAPTINGTIATTGLTLPAFTAGGTITMGASEITGTNVLIRGGATTGVVYIIAGTSNSKDSFWSLAGWEHATIPGQVNFFTYNGGAGTTSRMKFTGGLATDVLTWNAVYHVGLKFGLAGTATGAFTMDGATSGVVTVKVADIAGTWTMTLPAAVAAAAGYQLTDSDGAGLCTWTAAGSRREWKTLLDLPLLSPQEALSHILAVNIRPFRFRKGFGTGDYQTIYQGAMADEAPWAMHFPGEDGVGNILNPITTFGYTIQAFKAHEERIKELERELKLLKAGRA